MKANTFLFRPEKFVREARSHVGKPAINHGDAVPTCWRQPKQPDECMRVGLGQNGYVDCSGLVMAGISGSLGVSVEDWPSNLRHTRQMVEALKQSGERPRRLGRMSLAQANLAIGDLVFSHRFYDIEGEPGWHIAHVSIHTGYTNELHELRTQCVRLQAQARGEGMVIERPPGLLPPEAPESIVYSSASLARLAFGQILEGFQIATLPDEGVAA